MSSLRASSAKFRARLARKDLFGKLFCAICGGLARNDLWKKRMTDQVQRMTNGCGRLTCFSGYDCNISAWCMSRFTLALMAVLGCKWCPSTPTRQSIPSTEAGQTKQFKGFLGKSPWNPEQMFPVETVFGEACWSSGGFFLGPIWRNQIEILKNHYKAFLWDTCNNYPHGMGWGLLISKKYKRNILCNPRIFRQSEMIKIINAVSVKLHGHAEVFHYVQQNP